MKLLTKTLAALAALFLVSAASAITYDFTGGSNSAIATYVDGDLTAKAKNKGSKVDVFHAKQGLGVAAGHKTIDGKDKLILTFAKKVLIESFTVKWSKGDKIVVNVKGNPGKEFKGISPGNNIEIDLSTIGKKVVFSEGKDKKPRGYFLSSVTVASVPDSGTSMALLGFGLLGLVGLRSRFSK